MQASFLSTVVLPVSLAIIMLGMGLSLVPADFKRVSQYPKPVAIGLICQLILLPILGFIIATIVPMQPTMAMGLMIIALCPGGVSSNIITFLAKGDVALSVTLTAFSSMITVLTIPLFGNLAYQHFIGETASIALPIGKTIFQIFVMTIVPISVGMIFRKLYPKFAISIEKLTRKLAIGLLAIIIILLTIREWENLPNFIVQVGLGIVLLNSISMLIGFAVSKLLNLNSAQQICITIEVGLQNGALALAITVGILNNPEMAIPAAVYSLFMNLTGFLAILYGRKLAVTHAV
ncbi:MAG: bile acid:sodium symporter family protein [Sphaerospermopsis sp. SIO1G1]|nr:bile acid:sodium symporter family protein [Sphaerospermopsis sp. SIO1G1]